MKRLERYVIVHTYRFTCERDYCSWKIQHKRKMEKGHC